MNYWAGRRVFITGCTGFVGAWLTERLLDEHASVTGLIFDDDPNTNFYKLGLGKQVKCIPGTITDLGLIQRTIENGAFETIFHLAAQAIVTTANLTPLETWETNTRGTWNLLEAVRNSSTPAKVVVASSDKAYGDSVDLPYLETHPLAAMHPYDASKACADIVAQCYAKTYRLPVAVVRCGNIYGGGDVNFSRLIPGTIRSVALNERPLIRSDGLYTRDYLYVDDAVSGYLRVGESLDSSEDYGEAYNFGTGQPVSVLDVVERILRLMGREDLQPTIQNVAAGEILHQYLSTGKASQQLGWEPEFTLEAGLNQAISWYREFLADEPACV